MAGQVTGKMQAEQREAETKFWETPELVEKLFSILDLQSTLSLARVINKEILKRSMTPKVWDSLVKQSFDDSYDDSLDYELDFASVGCKKQTLTVAQKLASILKIMKTPKTLLLDTLDVICERHPPGIRGILRRGFSDQLQMICPRHTDPHIISTWGFILLEKMEASLQTREQSIKSIELRRGSDPGWSIMSARLLSAIGSRLSRQKETASSISINSRIYIYEDDKRSAQALYTIMQVNPAFVEVLVMRTTEREDWEWVAKAMKLQPGAVREVVTTKAALDPVVRTRSSVAKRNNIKDIWDAVGSWGFKIYARRIEGPMTAHCNVCIVKKTAAGWARLEKILDMSQDEFDVNEAKLRKK